MSNAYKPSYVWPNPAFPFRVYFDDPRLRIFIIENIQHNWEWMSSYHNEFRETDFFLVYCGWYHSPEFANEADRLFAALNLNKDQFFFLFNSDQEQENFASYGFNGRLINQNAWLDENLVMKPLGVKKEYDAIYVARRSAFKRHELAADVNNLALVAGINHGNAVTGVPPHTYLNDKQLSPEAVCEKINQAHCGLILSANEGACFASSEYLLCGVPVVSTPSTGGRDVWYDSYNAIVCEPNKEAVRDAVQFFLDNPRDPQKIRQDHIAKAEFFRQKFIELLAELFERFGINDVDPSVFFKENFFHKLRRSYRPNFGEIWN